MYTVSLALLGVVALRPVGVWRERHRVACRCMNTLVCMRRTDDSRLPRLLVDARLELALQLARRDRVVLAVVDGAYEVRRLRRLHAGELVPLGAAA